MSAEFVLGQRVKITGTAERKRDHVNWQPKDANRIASEVREHWPTLKELPGNPHYGLLRTRLTEAGPTITTEGVIVGKRTIMQGITEHYGYDGDAACFLPAESVTIWLVAFHLSRKHVMCFPHQVAAVTQ